MFAFEQCAAETTAKVSDIRVCCIMRFQFNCCTKTLWTFTANIRLHTFMTTYMYLKITTAAEFLLTNVTCQPSTLIELCLHQYDFGTMLPCTQCLCHCNVPQLLKLFLQSTLVQFVTRMDSHVSVQMTGISKRLVTQVTFVWSVSGVDSYMNV